MYFSAAAAASVWAGMHAACCAWGHTHSTSGLFRFAAIIRCVRQEDYFPGVWSNQCRPEVTNRKIMAVKFSEFTTRAAKMSNSEVIGETVN